MGVAWYYNRNHDGRSDGQHIEYILESQWRRLDEQLWKDLKNFHDAFQRCAALRSVKNLEKLGFWPANTIFHGTEDGEAVPRYRIDRPEWINQVCKKLEKSRILFLDPDNSVHRRPTIRHASFDEVKLLRKSGKALLLIKFPARVPYGQQAEAYGASLRDLACAERSITLRTTARLHHQNEGGPVFRSRWFTLIDGSTDLEARFRSFTKSANSIEGLHCTLDIGPTSL
ncbi:MAG: hypothetical protein ABSG51_04670 [Terracidiphilus sp.]